MNLNEKLPNPVQWAEGMLLAPQHFQQDQIYYERQLQNILQANGSYYWGLNSLDIDNSALADGKVIVRRLNGIFKDGLAIDYDAKNEEILELNLKAPDMPQCAVNQRFRVALAVPTRETGAASSSTNVRRFESVADESVLDENTGKDEDQVVVFRLKPILGLRVEDAAQRFVQLPLLELYQEPDGSFKRTDYLPPLLRLELRDWLGRKSLGRKISDLLGEVRQKAVMLRGLADDDKSSIGSVLENLHRRTIQQLVSQLPPIELLVDCEHAHPFQVFLELARLVGEVAAINTNPVPEKLQAYDHDNPGAAINQALHYISATLNLIELNYKPIAFTKAKGAVFGLLLDMDINQDTLCLAADLKLGQSAAEVREWIENCRIATQTAQSALIKHRQKAAIPEFVKEFSDLEIKQNESRVLFQIDFGDYVKRGENLTVVSMNRNLEGGIPQSLHLIVPATKKEAERA